MPLFKETKTISAYCPKCCRLAEHQKASENYGIHLPLLFLSCLAWTPVFLVALLLDRSKPYACTGCGSLARVGQPVEPSPPEKLKEEPR